KEIRRCSSNNSNDHPQHTIHIDFHPPDKTHKSFAHLHLLRSLSKTYTIGLPAQNHHICHLPTARKVSTEMQRNRYWPYRGSRHPPPVQMQSPPTPAHCYTAVPHWVPTGRLHAHISAAAPTAQNPRPVPYY